MLIVDTGVLLAAADVEDPDHLRCAELLEGTAGPLITTSFVVAETAYMIARQLGPDAEVTFFRSVAAGDINVEHLDTADLERVADLVEQYRDLPLGGTDASLIVLAERLNQRVVATLDHRHFSVVRPSHRDALQLLP